jgi:hypothetical protein
VILDGTGTQLYSSGVVSLTGGQLSLTLSTAVANAVTVKFMGATWLSVEPCIGELEVIGSTGVIAASAHYWRFEEGAFLTDSIGSANLSIIGTPASVQAQLPVGTQGAAFPNPSAGGPNQDAALFSNAGGGGSGLLQTTLPQPLTGNFTIEALVNFSTLTGQYGNIIAGIQDGASTNCSGIEWDLEVRFDGYGGSSPDELLLGLFSGNTCAAVRSGIILNTNTDYYVAAVYQASGSVTFYVKDLTHGTAMQTVTTTTSVTSLNSNSRFTIGHAGDGGYGFGVNGLIDEVRLTASALSAAQLEVH